MTPSNITGLDTNGACLTIVLPTYELHFEFAQNFLGSIARHAVDPHSLKIVIVVERQNSFFVDDMKVRFPQLHISSYATEQMMSEFKLPGSARDLLQRLGKFSFQSLKKIGGILTATTPWVLVMDSESKFLRDFSVVNLLNDYQSRKYVFFTKVSDRGSAFKSSLSEIVTDNAAELVGGKPHEWFMEYYHWFYETAVWHDIIRYLGDNGKLQHWIESAASYAVFENVLYYQYVRNRPQYQYDFIDSLQVIEKYLPAEISSRALQALSSGGLQIVGLLEHVISLFSVDELPTLEPLLNAYAMPFIRIEPYTIDPRVQEAIFAFPSVCALVSSHRARLMQKRIAVCIAGEFRSLQTNLRSISSFTAGVACDLFIHHWNTPFVPAIKDTLTPECLHVEERVHYEELASRIEKSEPNSKLGRDAGSLSMFHGIAASIALVQDRVDEYDLVVRLRPDMVFQDSLRDLLYAVASDESSDDNTIYVPDRFHSQGLNDQFAIGSTSAMLRYGQIARFVTENVSKEYFNPEHLMARHLLAEGLHLKTLPMCYVLMRSEPADFHRVAHMLFQQDITWWSAPLPGGGGIQPATKFFTAKVAAMEFLYERNQFGDDSLLFSAEYLTPEARAQWGSPFLKIDLKRDYKNPEVTLLVDPSTHDTGCELFIDVQPHGLGFVSVKPPGMIFIHRGHGVHDITLVRFGDNLDRPAAELIVSTHNFERVGRNGYSEESRSATVKTGLTEPEPYSEPVVEDILGVDNCGTSLMQRFLLAEPVNKAGFWRSTQATLALRRGRSCRHRGDLITAKRYYARVLALDPGRTREWVQYGHVLKDGGSLDQAIAAYAMALILQPGNPDARLHHNALQDRLALR